MNASTNSCVWGEAEIRGLHDKLIDLDQKLATCLGFPALLQSLDVRVGVIDGKLNMMKRMKTELDKLCATVADLEQKIESANVGAVTTLVVKEEPDFDPASEMFDDSGADWSGLFATDVGDIPIPNTEQAATRTRSITKSRRSPKKSKPNATYPNEDDEFNLTSADSFNENEPIIIAPNPELVNKSKELLGDVQEDSSTGKFHCPDCPKKFCHKKDLVRHYFLHSGVKPYSCSKCTAAFPRGDKLITHMKTHHFESSTSPSKVCKSSKAFGNNRSVSHPKPKPSTVSTEFHCKLCPEGSRPFRGAEYLAEHYVKHHEPPTGVQPIIELSVPCPICGKPFFNKKKLARHELTHLGKHETDRRYVCEPCGKSFCNRRVLNHHRAQKHPSPEEAAARKMRKQQASAARSAFRRRFLVKEVKLEEDVNFPCPDCGKVFDIKSKLNTHLNSCLGLRPFKCEECDQAFAQKPTLKVHVLNVHRKQKRYLCADCGRSFFLSSSYKRHVRSHRGIKPYVCKYCGQAFTGSNDVRRHEMIHTGIRKFQCPHCPLKFHRLYTLKRHLLIHTGEKPFICDLCGMGFTQTGSLRKHKEWHTRDPIRRPHVGERIRRQPRPEKDRASRLLKQLGMAQQQSLSQPQPQPAEVGVGISVDRSTATT